jgi:hypothetical protein
MCLGPATLAIVTAVGSAVSGGIQSIASYNQETQATISANRQSMRAYEIQMNQFNAQMMSYQESQRMYQEQIQMNAEAANRAYVSEQNKFQAEQRKAAEDAQKLMLQSMQRQGTVLASGRSGQSIGLLMADAEREYGRDLAMLGQNLAYSQEDYFLGTQSIFQDAKSANTLAANQRQMKPTQPGMPDMQAGPSSFGLIAGLGGSALQGLSTYSSLAPAKAEKPKIPKPAGK